MSNHRNYLHTAVSGHLVSKESALAGAIPGAPTPKICPIDNLPRYTPPTSMARRKAPVEVTFQREGELDKGLGISMRDLKDHSDKVHMVDADHAVLRGLGSGKTMGLFFSWPEPLNVPRRPRQFVVDLFNQSGKDVTRLEVGKMVAEKFYNFFMNDLKSPISFDALVLRKVFSEFERQLEIEIAVRVC